MKQRIFSGLLLFVVIIGSAMGQGYTLGNFTVSFCTGNIVKPIDFTTTPPTNGICSCDPSTCKFSFTIVVVQSLSTTNIVCGPLLKNAQGVYTTIVDGVQGTSTSI